MEIYLIRHGQSVNNALGDDLTRRVMDAPLTELGQQQAARVAQHLAAADYPEAAFYHNGRPRDHYGLTHLYCSAMQRALQTALPIGQALGLMPEVWVDIHEHGGIYLDDEHGGTIGYPGLTRAEIESQFPGYVLPDTISPAGWWQPERGMESEAAMIERAVKVGAQLRDRAEAGSDERIGLVTHGMFANWLIKVLLGQLPGSHIYYHHYNTAITRIDVQPDGLTLIQYHNRVAHLPLSLISY